jgi:hypothetical protein
VPTLAEGEKVIGAALHAYVASTTTGDIVLSFVGTIGGSTWSVTQVATTALWLSTGPSKAAAETLTQSALEGLVAEVQHAKSAEGFVYALYLSLETERPPTTVTCNAAASTSAASSAAVGANVNVTANASAAVSVAALAMTVLTPVSAQAAASTSSATLTLTSQHLVIAQPANSISAASLTLGVVMAARPVDITLTSQPAVHLEIISHPAVHLEITES